MVSKVFALAAPFTHLQYTRDPWHPDALFVTAYFRVRERVKKYSVIWISFIHVYVKNNIPWKCAFMVNSLNTHSLWTLAPLRTCCSAKWNYQWYDEYLRTLSELARNAPPPGGDTRPLLALCDPSVGSHWPKMTWCCNEGITHMPKYS